MARFRSHKWNFAFFGLLTIGAMGARVNAAEADELMPPPPAVPKSAFQAGGQAGSSSNAYRYGLFGWLDSRSSYGQGVYPEPFVVDDTDLEVNEFRLDWLHQQGHGTVGDLMTAEVEKGFGELTLELEVPYEWDSERAVDLATGRSISSRQSGFGNISLGARYPVYQYVASDGSWDTTVGVGFEFGIPTHSPISKQFEIVPKIFDDLKIGNFTLQSIFGYSTLLGPRPDGNTQTFEYGFVFGYTIPHETLPIPGVEQVIPVFELSGETLVNKDPGQNELIGNAAVRFNLKAIGRIQPRLGVGYVFPMDSNAREDLRWGMITSLVFEY